MCVWIELIYIVFISGYSFVSDGCKAAKYPPHPYKTSDLTRLVYGRYEVLHRHSANPHDSNRNLSNYAVTSTGRDTH